MPPTALMHPIAVDQLSHACHALHVTEQYCKTTKSSVVPHPLSCAPSSAQLHSIAPAKDPPLTADQRSKSPTAAMKALRSWRLKRLQSQGVVWSAGSGVGECVSKDMCVRVYERKLLEAGTVSCMI